MRVWLYKFNYRIKNTNDYGVFTDRCVFPEDMNPITQLYKTASDSIIALNDNEIEVNDVLFTDINVLDSYDMTKEEMEKRIKITTAT